MAELATTRGTIEALTEGKTQKGDPKLGILVDGVWVNAYPANQYCSDKFREELQGLEKGDWGIFHYTDDNFRSLRGIENVQKPSPEEKAEREQKEILEQHDKTADIHNQVALKCVAAECSGQWAGGKEVVDPVRESMLKWYKDKIRLGF